MRLKRPDIRPGPWKRAGNQIFAGNYCIFSSVPEGVPLIKHEGENLDAAAALPEVMDLLERALFFFEDQGCMPRLAQDMRSIMLKMGYTEEKDGEE